MDLLESIIKELVEDAYISIEEEDLGGLKGPHARAASKFWSQNWWRMVGRPGQGEYVLQHHWRGLLDTDAKKTDEWLTENTNHSIHEDLRHAAAPDWSGEDSIANLFGLAVFTNVSELRKSGGTITPVLGTKNSPQEAYQFAWKLPQPRSWLKIGRRKPVVFAPRGIGATSRRYAKLFAIDWGKYHIGVCRRHSFEIFYTSGKPGGMHGRYLLTLIDTEGGRRWNIRKPENQTPIASREKLEKLLEELKQKRQKYLVWSDGKEPPIIYSVRTGRPIRKSSFRVAVIKRSLEKGLIYGEVLVPSETDAQGEFETPEEIEDAAHNYMQGDTRLDYRHERLLRSKEAQLVESWIAPVTFKWEGREIKEGTWLIAVKVFSPSLKKEIETGELNAFSIKGLADKFEGGDQV